MAVYLVVQALHLLVSPFLHQENKETEVGDYQEPLQLVLPFCEQAHLSDPGVLLAPWTCLA